MKKLLLLALLPLLFISCSKSSRHYTIHVSKENTTDRVTLKVNDVAYSFTDQEFEKDITVKGDDVTDIDATYDGYLGERLELAVTRDGNPIADVVSDYSAWVIISGFDVESSSSIYASNGSGNSGGTTGNNCSSVQCSAYTQSGTRCKRMTTNCNGRCWQHQ